MYYTNLGQTGLKISAIGLGCGNFGGMGSAPELFGKVATREEAFAIMDRAWELGINYFDTANSYGGGRSESFIGEWLKNKGPAVRDQLILSTKVYRPVGDGPNDQGLSRRHILQQIDISLGRLGTDYLDLYITHAPDPNTPLEETLQALDDLIRQGKVRYIGAANIPAWLMAKALWISDRFQLHRYEWVQNSYSLLDRTDEREMFPLCQDQHLGHTPFSPLAGGWLTGKYRAGEPFPAGSRMVLRPDFQSLANEQTYPALNTLQHYATE
ncbi:MAG TPA: aldo/keto reductase, partial [Anaerolineae bacterium]|nr:aldo/keto reductase [Anaerolineae bacterium]